MVRHTPTLSAVHTVSQFIGVGIVPSGRVGKSFVSELARIFRTYADETMLEGITLKAAMTMPAQKVHQRSKAKDHLACLERWLTAWTERFTTRGPYYSTTTTENTQKCEVEATDCPILRKTDVGR